MKAVYVLVCLLVLGWTSLMLAGSTSGEDQASLDLATRYVLETVRAFRSAYVLHVVEHVNKGGVRTREDWTNDVHAIPLPAQFVKAAAAKIDSFEIGLISLTPISPANKPRTDAEADALLRLAKDHETKILTFVDGTSYKGVSADVALVQSCVDCHNSHPNSPWRTFKKWDVMGGVVVRINRQNR
jgi:hypothetical protein